MPEFPWRVFKISFKALYSDQASSFSYACSTFSVVFKIRLVNRSFEFLNIEKEYDKEIYFKRPSLGCRLDHKLLFEPSY